MPKTSINTQDIALGAVTAPKLANAGVTAGSYTNANITVNAQGQITVASNGTSTTINFSDNEIPTGTINSTNTTFTLAHAPIANSQHIYKNGLRQNPGAGNDYTISTNIITFLSGNIPQTGDIVIVDYRY